MVSKRSPNPHKMTSRAIRTSIDLAEDVRTEMHALLNQQLADAFDLFSQTKQAHWNVKGRDFMQLHELFDMLAEGLESHIDIVAERITALGGVAQGTVRMAATASRLPEYLLEAANGEIHLQALGERYADLAHTTRMAMEAAEEAGDLDTTDLLTDLSRDLDKWLWFLEAHLQE